MFQSHGNPTRKVKSKNWHFFVIAVLGHEMLFAIFVVWYKKNGPCWGLNPQFAGNHQFSAFKTHSMSGKHRKLCVEDCVHNPG